MQLPRPATSSNNKQQLFNPSNMDSDTPANQLKILAPVMTRDVTLPNTNEKVPMVMVPVPDSRTLMAIPISQLNSHMMEARDLLNWNDGIGTLDGCDLRFRINQLGCLELLDSDEESCNDEVPKNKISAAVRVSQPLLQQSQQQQPTQPTPPQPPSPQSQAPPLSASPKINPGSSLLKNGPDKRRPKATNSILEKLIPKQKLDEMKPNVQQWTTDDVKKFIDSIPGCNGYGELFEAQQICGRSLMYLDQKDLLDVINMKLGPAVKIYHAISLLKS